MNYNLNKEKSIETKNFLLSIFGSVPFGLIALDYNGIIKIINEQALDILDINDRSVNGLINKNINSMTKNLPELYNKISKFLYTENNPFHIERMICKDKILSIKGDNHFDGLILTIEDITQREYYLSKILKQTFLLKDVEKLSNIGIWNWVFKDRILTWTDGLYRVYGLNSNSRISLKKYINMVHPKNRKSILKRFNYPENYDPSFSYDETIINLEGHTKYLKVWGNLKYDSNNKPIEMYGLSLDVTERTEIELREKEITKELEIKVKERTSELEISKNELNFQVDTLNHVALVSITNVKGIITYANEIFCKTSGYNSKEIIGKTNTKLNSGEHSVSFYKKVINTISKGKTWQGELINKSKNGSIYHINNTIVPFFNIKGNIEKYVSVGFEITKEKKLQNQLHSSLSREKELSKLKSHFVSTASHQFRTPLAIIQSNSDLLEIQSKNISENQGKNVLRPIARIKNEIQGMTKLMDEVLVLGKISSGSINVNLKPLDINSLLTDITEQFNSFQYDQRILEFEKHGKSKKIIVDSLLLNHAINNLISNAFKYSSNKNPKLALIYERNEIIIEISDEGIGIPKKSITNLFTPFHRCDNVMNIPGTGLGLSIAKEYIELNNGNITVNSEENKGTKFTIKFPAK